MKKTLLIFALLLISSSQLSAKNKVSDYEVILNAYWTSQQSSGHILTKDYIDSKKKCAKKFRLRKGYTFKKYGPLKKIVKNGDIKNAKKVKISKNKFYALYGYDLFPTGKSASLNSKYRFYYYKSLTTYKGFEKRPLILISPSIKGIKTGRVSGVENKWAKFFAKNGIDSIITDLDEDILIKSRPIRKLDNWMISQINGLRLTLDFISYQLSSEVDTNKIGAIGASLGGIRTVLLMSFETSRIKVGAIIASGGHFADLWVTSKQKMIAAYRKYRMKVEKTPGSNKREKLENLYHYVKQITCTDPVFFTDKRTNFADDIKMYIAGNDTKVPTKVQLELWKALGMPINAEITSLNHRATILLQTLSKRKDIFDFFDYKLNL